MIEIDRFSSLPELMSELEKEKIPTDEYKKYVDRFLEFRAREQGIPINGQFELTPLCNLDCKMCYVHMQKEQLGEAKLLPVEVWKNLMQQAVEHEMLHADLTGGECLTYPGFDELYLFLQSKGVKISVKTNGVLLNHERIEFFRNNPPTEIQVSIYGSSEDAYEAVTGRRVYGIVMQNLAIAKEAGLPVIIAITPSRFMKDIKAVAKWAHDAGYRYTINAGLFDPREETGRNGRDIDISPEEYCDVLNYVHTTLKGYEPITEEKREANNYGFKEYESNIGIRCAAGRSSFDINWNGKMYACTNLKGILAEPLKTGFAESWKRIHEMAKQYILPIECETCKDYNVCIKCAAAHQNAPCGHVNSEICKRTRILIEARLC